MNLEYVPFKNYIMSHLLENEKGTMPVQTYILKENRCGKKYLTVPFWTFLFAFLGFVFIDKQSTRLPSVLRTTP